MPFIAEVVTVIVDGYALIGWQDVSVSRSMQSAEISFNLGATTTSQTPEAKRLRYGREVQLLSTPVQGGMGPPDGGDLLCHGYIGGYSAEYDEDSKKVTLDGRSKSADAVDCHPVKHKTGRFENKTLLEVAKELDEVNCGFSTDQQLDKLAKVQRQPHDTIFQTVEREARRAGQMLLGQPDGSIKITRAGTKRHAGALVLGQSPVRSMSVKIRCDQKFSPIVGRGQRAKGTGAKNLRMEERETDSSVGRHRPLLIMPEGDWTKKEFKKRLRWDRLRRAGYGTTISVKVSTWRDDAGALWEPGRLMAIVNPFEDIDSDYCLSSANFRQDDAGGTLAYLEFTDPKAAGGKAGMGKSDKAFDAGEDVDDDSEGDP